MGNSQIWTLFQLAGVLEKTPTLARCAYSLVLEPMMKARQSYYEHKFYIV